MVQEKSMFTDEEFAMMKKVFETNRSELANNPEEIGKEMRHLEQMMHDTAQRKEKDYEIAIQILLQGRNFLARYIEEPEISYPINQVDQLSPLEKKHVALYIAGGESPFFKAVIQATEMFKEVLRFRSYIKIPDLLEAILANEVCGIVAFHLEKTSFIEGSLRHDLKNRDGFDYNMAQAYPLPPCVDFHPPHPLMKAITEIIRLQNGIYQPASEENFYLPDALPHLLPHMHIPETSTKITIIDDNERAITGMEEILGSWPNILSVTIIQNNSAIPKLPPDTKIVLLDENLGKLITGTQVAKDLIQKGFTGIIASTSGGKRPKFAKWHFGAKEEIVKQYQMAWEFVYFINSLLKAIDL